MYVLPDNFDNQLLSSCYLEMICFGPRVTKLEFSRPRNGPGMVAYKVTFCVEAGLSYQIEGIPGEREFSDPVTCAPLIGLLLQDVTSVTCVGNSSLHILFEGGATIMINADIDADFEFYSIYLNSGEVIVV